MISLESNHYEYLRYFYLIQKLSHSLNKKLGIEYEEAVSEINMAFVRCSQTYKKENGKFTTYLYKAHNRIISNEINKRNREKRQGELVYDYPLLNYDTPERLLLLKEKIEKEKIMKTIFQLLKRNDMNQKAFKRWLTIKLREYGFKFKTIRTFLKQ